MTKTEFCHKVANFDEAIYDTENSIADLESRLRWDDADRREWYQERLNNEKEKLEALKEKLAAFCAEYGDVFDA